MAGQDSEQRYQNVFTGTLSDNSGDLPGSAGDRAVFGRIAAAVSNGCLDRLLGELWSLFRNNSLPMASERQDRIASLLRSSRRGTPFSSAQPENGLRSGCSFNMRLNAATRTSGMQPGNGWRMEMPAGPCSHLLPAPDFRMI